jgi:hydroxymethylpyrimidine/phosphomethylpyrimidine kinase
MVLCFSGHDPSGGAGLQADIETLFQLGCHPCSVITALTQQDTVNVGAVFPQAPEPFRLQAETLMADIPIAAIKIGLLGSDAVAMVVSELLAEGPEVPVVLDPILAAGGGQSLASHALADIIKECLLPRVAVLTPNSTEARRLTGLSCLDDCARALLDRGCKRVLITGTHEDEEDVVNRLYGGDGLFVERVRRLPGTYHGSGCTLASAVAAFLAHGLDAESAVRRALAYTFKTLEAGYAAGRGQLLPNRRVPPS